jgi:hypothetical protein
VVTGVGPKAASHLYPGRPEGVAVAAGEGEQLVDGVLAVRRRRQVDRSQSRGQLAGTSSGAVGATGAGAEPMFWRRLYSFRKNDRPKAMTATGRAHR